MLKLWRRHRPDCKYLEKGRDYVKCSCPIWADGMLDGKRVRRALDTLNWQKANEIIRELEADGDDTRESSVSNAVNVFIEDCEQRRLSAETVSKFKEVLHPFRDWSENRAISTVRAIDLPTLRLFVRALPNSSLTVVKKIERLRTFFGFCEDEKWIDKNPATKLKKPKVTNPPVIPFTPEEYEAIVDAIAKYPTRNSFGYDNRKRVRAFVYTLRYTAFRIADATILKKSAVKNGKVFIRTMKTGEAVYLPVPKLLLEALQGIGNDIYFFWSGKGKLKSAKADWQRTLTRLFELAGVEGHAHMFRHTLAVELLEKNISVEHVAAILGNSPAIVHKHYAPWIASRQKAMEAAVSKIWN